MTRLVCFASLLSFLSACGGGNKQQAAVTIEPLPSASASATPVVHATPTKQAFIDAGCKATKTDDEVLDCKGARQDFLSMCASFHILPVQFDPPAVVGECYFSRRDVQGDVIRQTGCMLPSGVRLVAARGSGELTVIHSADELKKAFAPVTSSEEAIAFAVAVTGNQAVMHRNDDPHNLGLTDVHFGTDGFHVKLFGSQLCGCSHPTWAVHQLVGRDGVVTEVGRKQIWEDPKSQGLCVD